MKKIFVATKNKGKIEEIKSYLEVLGYEVLSLIDIDTPQINDIEETGDSFRENALLKAKSIFDILKIPVISDDSGLEVDSLGGKPGVYSARYSGINSNAESNNEKLLKELFDVKPGERTARFRCVICLYDGTIERYFEGACEGEIISGLRGDKGFGYDPLFIPEGYSLTFAELGKDVKNLISHRGKALKSLVGFLESNENM